MDTNSMKNDINKEKKPNNYLVIIMTHETLPFYHYDGFRETSFGIRKPRKSQKDARTSLPSGVFGSRCLTTPWGHSDILARPPMTETSQAVDVSRMVPFLVKHLSCRFDELVVALADAR
jgi:hypothetical protein